MHKSEVISTKSLNSDVNSKYNINECNFIRRQRQAFKILFFPKGPRKCSARLNSHVNVFLTVKLETAV